MLSEASSDVQVSSDACVEVRIIFLSGAGRKDFFLSGVYKKCLQVLSVMQAKNQAEVDSVIEDSLRNDLVLQRRCGRLCRRCMRCVLCRVTGEFLFWLVRPFIEIWHDHYPVVVSCRIILFWCFLYRMVSALLLLPFQRRNCRVGYCFRFLHY